MMYHIQTYGDLNIRHMLISQTVAEVQYISMHCHVCWKQIALTDCELQCKEFQVSGEYT